MRTNKTHWGYSHPPRTPQYPNLMDEVNINIEEIIETFGTYTDVNLGELEILKKLWLENRIGLKATFNVCVEDIGTHGDTEYQLQLKACFTRPRTENEIKEAQRENVNCKQRFIREQDLHKLQMKDYELTQKEIAEEKENGDKALYEQLKQKYEGK